jgi:hypothetical protein
MTDAQKSESDDALLSVWKQALVERRKTVRLGAESYPVRRTAKSGLAQVDFAFQGREIRGLEQNPKKKSRWAQLARRGSKVMQFLQSGRYIAVVSDAKVTHYTGKKK